MKTKVYKITADAEKNAEIFRQAKHVIESGGVVAFPTETVYGLGANAFDPEACRKIYEAKGRPSDNPLILHVSDMSGAEECGYIGDRGRKLAGSFWPGPLTMVADRKPGVPDTVTGGLDTVALRMPAHPTAGNLLRTVHIPVAAPSANLSGSPSPTTAAHVLNDLDGRIDMVIVDDTVNVGLESTIIDVTSESPVILRPGVITREQLEEALGETVTFAGDDAGEEAPRAPGMKYRHYAPEAGLFLVCGEEAKRTASVNRLAAEAETLGKKVFILAHGGIAGNYKCGNVIDLGRDPVEAASSLYGALRQCDDKGADVIFAEGFEEKGVGIALMNRLKKAAGGNIIQV